eukprot:jgi/Tetstr1/466174/TSEL_010734.t1
MICAFKQTPAKLRSAMNPMRLSDGARRREHNLCNPPRGLIDDLIIKLHTSGAAATVIVPYRPDRSWHHRLSEMASEVVVFPPSPDLFAPGRLGHHAHSHI